MGLFDGCLLASDIDGTLLSNGKIAQRAVDNIRWFVSESGKFALATGRSVGAVSPVLERLDGLIGPSVVANGAMIYDYSEKKILFEKTLPKEEKIFARKAYENFPEIGIEIHSGEKVLVLRRNNEIFDHEVYEKLDSVLISLEEAEKNSWNKIIMASDISGGIEPVKEFAKSMGLTGSNFIDTTAMIDGRKRPYLEQVPKGVSKATALETLCSMINIKKGCYFAIGDYYNDIEMISSADIGAVTSDAPDELKAVAKFVGGTAQEGAVADFIEYLATIVPQL